jgi:hypothetical protein
MSKPIRPEDIPDYPVPEVIIEAVNDLIRLKMHNKKAVFTTEEISEICTRAATRSFGHVDRFDHDDDELWRRVEELYKPHWDVTYNDVDEVFKFRK